MAGEVRGDEVIAFTEDTGQRGRPRRAGPLPAVVRRLDYEVELALVMGAGGRIAGYAVADDVSARAETCTLEPGDLILTGTPAGVGVYLDPPRSWGRGTSSGWRSTVCGRSSTRPPSRARPASGSR